MYPVRQRNQQPSIHMLRPGPIRDKARDLAKEHMFMQWIDDGYDPYLIPEDKIKSAVTTFLWNTGEMFFKLAEERLNGKGNGSSPD